MCPLGIGKQPKKFPEVERFTGRSLWNRLLIEMPADRIISLLDLMCKDLMIFGCVCVIPYLESTAASFSFCCFSVKAD